MDALNQFTSKLMKFMNIFLLNLALYGPHAQLRFPSSSQGCLAARLATGRPAHFSCRQAGLLALMP